MPANKQFYDAVRPLFGGRLSQQQVDGMKRIVEYGEEWGYNPDDLAYILKSRHYLSCGYRHVIDRCNIYRYRGRLRVGGAIIHCKTEVAVSVPVTV